MIFIPQRLIALTNADRFLTIMAKDLCLAWSIFIFEVSIPKLTVFSKKITGIFYCLQITTGCFHNLALRLLSQLWLKIFKKIKVWEGNIFKQTEDKETQNGFYKRKSHNLIIKTGVCNYKNMYFQIVKWLLDQVFKFSSKTWNFWKLDYLYKKGNL